MGAIVNGIVILVGGFLGLQIRSGIPSRIHERLMEGIGLCVMGIGIVGLLDGQNTLVLILSVVIGTLIGEGIDIDKRVIEGINKLESYTKGKTSEEQSSLTQGFLSASMIFCIGSMAIVGSLESGLTGDNTTLYTKSILDGITSILLASSLGSGVLLSALPVVAIQGSIIIFASFFEPYLPTEVIVEMISVGSLLLIALGMNMVGITKLKIMNFTPAIIMPILLMLFI